MKEFRCYKTDKLLCKAGGDGQIEIMNPDTRTMNYVGPSRKHQDLGPQGQEFAKYASDFNCAQCGRLLGRGIGDSLVVEIKCKYCHKLNLFDLHEMERKRMQPLSTIQQARYSKLKQEHYSKWDKIQVV